MNVLVSFYERRWTCMITRQACITIRNAQEGLAVLIICIRMWKKEGKLKQDAYTLHKPIHRHFKRNRVIVGGIDQQWQMDLADMQSMQKCDDGYRYLLVCIDVFSKYIWVVPLKNKKGPSLVEAFKIILASRRKPIKIITDQGTEFFNKHFWSVAERQRHWIVQHV